MRAKEWEQSEKKKPRMNDRLKHERTRRNHAGAVFHPQRPPRVRSPCQAPHDSGANLDWTVTSSSSLEITLGYKG